MKQLIVISIIIILFTNVKAQTYESVIDTNKLWSTLGVGCNGSYNSHYVKLTNDTVIGTETYKKVYQSFDSLMINWTLLGFIREDSTRKVFARDLSGNEGLIYDFNPNIGDTINFYNALSGRVLDMVVDTVYNSFYANKTRKIVEVYNANTSSSLINTELWIEGVGSSSGLDQSGYRALGTCGVAWHLACYYENDTLLYDNSQFAYCYYYTDNTYESIISEYKLWSVVNKDSLSNLNSYYLKITTDTLINGLEYKKLEKSTYEFMYVWENAGYIREDSEKRVYHWQNGTEYLIYDFELVKGDTLEIGNPLFQSNTIQVIVDTMYIEEIAFKDRDVIKLRNLADNTIEYWVEGIGSMAGLDKSGYHSLNNIKDSFDLLCFYERDTLKFSDVNYSYCYYKSTSIGESYIDDIILYPNPASTYVKVESGNLKVESYTIYDIYGRNLTGIKPNMFSKSVGFNVKSLKTGIYFIKLQTNKGNIVKKFVKD